MLGAFLAQIDGGIVPRQALYVGTGYQQIGRTLLQQEVRERRFEMDRSRTHSQVTCAEPRVELTMTLLSSAPIKIANPDTYSQSSTTMTPPMAPYVTL